jgi:hypothetical protein
MPNGFWERLKEFIDGPPPQTALPLYHIHPESDGTFALEQNQTLGARKPRPDEELLASKISQRVDWYRKIRPTLEADRGVTADYIEGLRDIAVRALTNPVQRWEFAEQDSRFADLYETPVNTPKGSFTVNIVDEEVEFHRIKGAAKPTKEMLQIVRNVLKLERLIAKLYKHLPDPAERQRKSHNAQEHLRSAGRFAMDGETELAEAALEDIEADALLDCGASVRLHYLKGLALHYFGAGVLSCLLIAGYGKWIEYYIPLAALKISPDRLAYIAAATISLLFGAWLSAANRIQSNERAVLETLISETLTYGVRTLFVLGIGWLVLLLMHKQVVVVTLGSGDSFSTKEALLKLPAAVLIGALLGLAERTLPTAVIRRAEKLASDVGPKT